MEDARALLDGLMGNHRNMAAKDGVRKARKFSDEDICRKFLLGLCPNDMFKNTKTDMGPCGKVHNEHLKDEFEKDKDAAWYKRKWRGVLRTQLRSMLQDVDRRIDTNSARIAEKEAGGGFENEANREVKEEVSEKLKQAEAAADDNQFEKSRAIMKEVEAARQRLDDLETKKADKNKKQEVVCDVCGLMVSGAEYEDIKRLGRGWHTDGKQHIGFMQIREKLKEMEDQIAEDKRKGLSDPSPSPVRVEKPKRPEKSKEQKSDSRRQSPPRRKSPSPRRGKQDDKRRKGSRSRSRRGVDKKAKGRGSPSPLHQNRSRYQRKSRSRSRGRNSRSRGKHSRSRNRKQSSPKRKSRSAKRSPSPAAARKAAEEEEPKVEEKAAPLEEAPESVPEPEPIAEPPKSPSPSPEPIPPKPVRFVLGLGKLNVTSLKK